MKRLFTVSLLGVALATSSAWGALLTFTDQAAFIASAVVNSQNGAGALATESFNGGVASLFTFTNNPGFSSIIDPAPVDGNFVRQSRVVNGGYSELVTPIAGATVTGGTLTGTLTAWGASFDTSVGGLGQGLNIIVNHVGGAISTFTNVQDVDGLFFFGVTVDGATPNIASITIQAGNNLAATGEQFQIDNILIEGPVTLDEEPPPAIPEPSTFGLMGLAMVGLGLIRKARA